LTRQTSGVVVGIRRDRKARICPDVAVWFATAPSTGALLITETVSTDALLSVAVRRNVRLPVAGAVNVVTAASAAA
jgi:hypothetical protein